MERRYLECFSSQLGDQIGFKPSPYGGQGSGTFYHFVDLLTALPEQLLFYP